MSIQPYSDFEKTEHTATSIAVRIPVRLIGLTGLVGAVGFILALMSWNVNDPSLSYATDQPASNWLGYPGAVIADLLFQFFGLAAIFLMMPPALWALSLIREKIPVNFGRRATMWLTAVVTLSGVLAFFPVPSNWPLPTGLGGVTGLGFVAAARTGLGDEFVRSSGWMFALLLAIVSLTGFWYATRSRAQPASGITGMSGTEAKLTEQDSGNTGQKFLGRASSLYAVALGALTHIVLSALVSVRKTRARRETENSADTGDTNPLSGLGKQQPAGLHGDDSRINILPDQKYTSVNRRVEPHFGDDRSRDAQRWVEGTRTDLSDDHDPFATVRNGSDDGAASRAHETELSETLSTARPRPGRMTIHGQRRSETDAFQLPDPAYLATPPDTGTPHEHLPEILEQKARLLEGVLEDFGVRGAIINVRPGPVVTLYELEPAPGIKSSRVIGLADDIARSVSAISARVAVVPGRNAIGIELPNTARETVYLREMLGSADFKKVKGKLPLCLGKTIGGEPVIADLARMPHLLIAGTTGSGKSVAVNTFILSLLYRWTPEQCRLIMIDPKMLELSVYDGIPHLLTPVVTDPAKAVTALKWAVREMEDRYRKMSRIGVRNIDGFNRRVTEANKKGEIITRTVQTGFDKETGEPIFESEEFDLEPLPFIVVIVDEMADLMMVAGKDIEGAIQRLAQMARAAGIHLIMATQRPSVDVITGTIKANFPTRISFQVTSKIDSRTILGEQGAEQLLGMGDMLYMAGGGRVKRLHGPFVADREVETVVNHLKQQGAPEYLESVTDSSEETSDNDIVGKSGDELYDKAINIVLADRKVSTSYIQRRLSIGYNRAATLIERMEKEGVISPANHAGKREILVGDDADSP